MAVRLHKLREQLEACDSELLTVLGRRMALAEEVARAKLEMGMAFRDRSREEQVLRGIRQMATEQSLDPHAMEQLYRTVFEMSIARQQSYLRSRPEAPLRVAYQGGEGSYSQIAAQRFYTGREGGVVLEGFETLGQAMDAVRSGQADLALLPIENSSAGSINELYELLDEGGVTISHEVVYPVEHHLLGLPGASVEELTTVYSHPQALAQCDTFLRNLPHVRTRPELDSAYAASRVREEGDPCSAAIASEAAGRHFGLVSLRTIPHGEGFTRYVELAREAPAFPDGASCKTSLLLTLDHRPGALARLLAVFTRHGVNLLKLESRSALGTPELARFYVDLEGHPGAGSLGAALAEVEALARELKLLGTYPMASRGGTAAAPLTGEP